MLMLLEARVLSGPWSVMTLMPSGQRGSWGDRLLLLVSLQSVSDEADVVVSPAEYVAGCLPASICRITHRLLKVMLRGNTEAPLSLD